MPRTSRPTYHTAATLEALVMQLRSEIDDFNVRITAMKKFDVDKVNVTEGQAEVERAIKGIKAFWKKLDSAITERRKELGHFGTPAAEPAIVTPKQPAAAKGSKSRASA